MSNQLRYHKRCVLCCGERRVTVAPMERADIADVAALYRSVHINAENYRERLSLQSDLSFQRIGGMFLILNERRLGELLESDRDILMVARDEAGEAIGVIWHALDDSTFEDQANNPYTLFRECTEFPRWLGDARSNGVLAYGKEIIISQKNTFPGLSRAMFRIIYDVALSNGFTCGTGEVYRVTSYEDASGVVPVELINMRSLSTLIHVGGVHVGFFNTRRVPCEGFIVNIESQILWWDYARASRLLDETLARKEITRTTEG